MQLKIGNKLNPHVIDGVSRESMQLVAALMDDPNPIHFDHASLASLDLGDRLITQGPIAIGFLLTMIAKNMGRADSVVHSNARFLDSIFEGDRVECTGEIIAIDSEHRLATLACKASVAKKDVVTMTAQINFTTSNLI